MDRYVCIHGHFYQPPRENPWLEEVELQDSAYPHHDWNERIAAECYAPNGMSRILDADGRIERIVNNYARISFNVGPTLLAWLEVHRPDAYRAILDADRESVARFSGHGSAIAQVYNHMILPLANTRDRRTQVLWGIRDFEHRFGRRPEGMWLAETAVDVESLEILAEHGILFTILAPSQAARVKKHGGRKWREVADGTVDPTMPYEVRLPSGRRIAVFFYDGPISQAIAFEGLLADGARFAERLTGAFSDARTWPQLVHIATDGETYGHHHRHGEMALAWALHAFESNESVKVTVYGEYLERHPPTHQAEIKERTAWSCSHGVDRWWTDCGCNSGGHAGWNQAWRTPLRDALDWLRDFLAPRFEAEAARLLRDPWAARDDYVDVVLDRSPDSTDAFLAKHAVRPLDAGERIRVLKLLELQRHAMLMYTSCGWFFDDVSGIETVQVIAYAGRAVQLARETLGEDPEGELLPKLAAAKSNVPDHADGARIWEKWVKPAALDLRKVAAHYAVASVFETFPETSRVFAYAVEREEMHRVEAGRARALVGRARVTSEVTRESAVFSFGVLHFGDHNLQAAVRTYRGEEAFDALKRDVEASFGRGDVPEVIRLLDRHFDRSTFSLKSLFRDRQREVLDLILTTTLEEAEGKLREVYEGNTFLLRFLGDLDMPPPLVLRTAAEFVLNTGLRRVFGSADPDLERARSLLDVVARDRIALDEAGLAYAVSVSMDAAMERLRDRPEDAAALSGAVALATFVESLPFEVDLWRSQNLFWEMVRDVLPGRRQAEGDDAREWVAAFGALGGKLSVRVA